MIRGLVEMGEIESPSTIFRHFDTTNIVYINAINSGKEIRFFKLFLVNFKIIT